ncbi:DUF6415 family natural product biosynthesis protein [Streptomyces noursei]|uniref:DUF6415 family natural product biosynthesis protein n=1 Tax=Streptomyces noursei TaxID=1971 RepID=UPI001677AD4F|nr:DUF6415 family natural product biosynthesis protein [Streptomyces noursei]MCZ1014826.1 DUF6415 family natural product biosynthesis protein [Streptomyces noursei]GGX48224.1 hypothetical protein GCM10010341_82350 [Streptomyces noursei]
MRDPIDAETIAATIRHALHLGAGRPSPGELTEAAETLTGHIALLLTEARETAHASRPVCTEGADCAGRFHGIERQMKRGLGDSALSAHVQVHLLARDCQWLLAHHTARVGW